MPLRPLPSRRTMMNATKIVFYRKNIATEILLQPSNRKTASFYFSTISSSSQVGVVREEESNGSTTSSNNSNSNNNNDNNNRNMNEWRDRLARSSLKQVPIHGWTLEAITAAAIHDPQLSLSMVGMLSSSSSSTPTDLVHWFMNDMNQQLKKRKEESHRTLKNRKVTTTSSTEYDEVFDSIQWRLRQVIPLVESGQWHKGMAIGLSTPMTTKAQLHEFIEIISPPGVSTEYQIALGGMFAAAELHLLTDSSQDYQDTWNFLRRALTELEMHKDRDSPSREILTTLSDVSNNVFNHTRSIPWMASMAVATSLAEGAASLFFPNVVVSAFNRNSVDETRPSDYHQKNE